VSTSGGQSGGAGFLSLVSTTTSLTATPNQVVHITGGSPNITLPPAPVLGTSVWIVKDSTTGTPTVQANTGQTINGSGAALPIDTGFSTRPAVKVTAISATQWWCESMAGDDMSIGMLVSGILQWANSTVGHSAAKAANYSIISSDDYIRCNGTFTVTFGTTMVTGQYVRIMNVGAGTITLAAAGAGTINGPTSLGPGVGCEAFCFAQGASPVVDVFAVG
jgi:hypothetical protein